MKKYLLSSLFITVQIYSFHLYAAPAFWCDAKEKDLTEVSDVPEFKALKVKTSQADGDTGQRAAPYSQTSRGLLSMDSKDVRASDIITLIFQDDSGREYKVERFPDNSLRMIIQGSGLALSGSTYLGISGKATEGASNVILNCKSLM